MPKRIQRTIAQTDEPWSVATLDDGTRVRVRLIFEYVEQEIDDKGAPMVGPDGQPLLFAKFSWVISTMPTPGEAIPHAGGSGGPGRGH